jgi:GT2 family glycosyltransferase
MPHSASVIICVYTDVRWASLAAGVEALALQTRRPDEVIIVVDHNDALRGRARSAFPGATVVDNRYRHGLSGARNTGVEQATSEVIAFLDDDAVPHHDWLERLLEPFAEADVVGAGGVADPEWTAPRPRWFPEEFLWTVGCSYRGLPTESVEIRNPIGCSMAFRREALERAGGFATELGRVGRIPLGCEETELSIRVGREHPGRRILHVPASLVRHEVTAPRATWSYFRSRCFAEGISKAAVSRMTGAGPALSSERTYVSRTLPSGVAIGLGDALRGDLGGVLRAAAIVAGLVTTTLGYFRGRLSRAGIDTTAAAVASAAEAR